MNQRVEKLEADKKVPSELMDFWGQVLIYSNLVKKVYKVTHLFN